MMRKWLVVLLAIALLYALPKLNTRGRRRDFPLMKRINETINILAWVLLAVYFGAFLYWLWTEFIR
ncbi:MAG: hypothetical protein IH583_03465 [Candidatus Aminicenantes bacterium]|jgi:hypothetical protein|nr:hypothetical protein [Candidatus Aminicenantes bacterium]